MKHIIKYLGALIAVVLIGTAFSSCAEDDDNGSAKVGLGIKVFFPTKVVTNQPMTINGSGFTNATEIEFPGGQKVTNFEIVSDDMIRVNAPSGIAADGKSENFPHLRFRGLMTIGKNTGVAEDSRECFAFLRNLQQKFLAKGGAFAKFDQLSMGMTGDLEVAIEEGSTMIRVGTALFGGRDYSKPV